MVNWNDPTLVYNDSLALIKLNHAVAGIYIWETVFTAGFELDILRRKRPYKWTIWLYLGTRYTALTTIILFLVRADGGKVSCQAYTTAMAFFEYASWEFASLVIVLRVIAIWGRNRIVSTLAGGLWLAGLGLNIYCLTLIKAFNDPSQQTCVVTGLNKNVISAVAILVIDTVLVLSMLIGLLRNADRSSAGIWYILYQQCFIWIALAVIAEVPLVVFLLLNLNAVWNEMFGQTSIAILAIGATRMYRSLCQHGSFTEYMSSAQPKLETANPGYRATTLVSHMNFAPTSQSDGTMAMSEAPVFTPTDHTQFSASSSTSVHENTEDKAVYDMP